MLRKNDFNKNNLNTDNSPLILSSLIIGIDIAKSSFDISFLQNNIAFYARFCNHDDGFLDLSNYLTNHLTEHKITCLNIHFIMESTNIYWQALALWAYQAGFLVSVVNPAFIRAYAKSLGIRNKTDKQDAALLARYGRHENPPLWQPPSPIEDKMISLVRQRRHSKHKLTNELTRLETANCHTLSFIQSTISYWQTHIQKLDCVIWQTINSDVNLKVRARLLHSIPGIGKKSIPPLLALIGDGSRFASSKHLVSFVGLVPRAYQSGSSINKQTTIGHSGRPDIREVLYMPAVVVSFGRYKAFQPFVQRLLANGKCKKQVIVAVMRKLLAICHVVIKTGQPFNPSLHQ